MQYRVRFARSTFSDEKKHSTAALSQHSYLNFYRPCCFARTRTNAKGKIEKFYPYADMMTPYDKLKSLRDAHTYLKTGLNFSTLDALALSLTDNEAAALLNKVRTKLFDKIHPARKRA